MRSSVRLTALAAVACTAFALTACSSNDAAEEPVFSAPSTAATTSAAAAESSTEAATESETETSAADDADETATDGPTSTDGQTLRNDNGSFRITNKTPGPGAVEVIDARYRDIDETGFASLGLSFADEGFNGILQAPLGKEIYLWIGAYGLGDENNSLRDDFARVRITALDGDGNVVLDSDNDVETRYEDWPPAASDFRGYGISNTIVFPSAGDFLLKVEIQQPGYEKFFIEQPIKIVA